MTNRRITTPGRVPLTALPAPGTLEADHEGAAGTRTGAVLTLVRPTSYECANCAGRFPAKRVSAYCSPRCDAEACVVRDGRRHRAERGNDLPAPLRAALHAEVLHALTGCEWDKWSGDPEPDPVQAPEVAPLAEYLNPNIPASDTFALRGNQVRVRVLAKTILRPCDAPNWDGSWREWVDAHAE
ncbi:MAG: hypothetical protein ACT4PP_15025 [Sporichthyaceae bacterium]